MRFRVGIFFCTLALLQIAGGHWAFLQTTAWIGMVIQYSQQHGISAGVAQTFDGSHPCSMCLAIKDAKEQEQKKPPVVQTELKKDFPADETRFQIHQPWSELVYPRFVVDMQGIVLRPAVPPPRIA
jgi:hypothetical protein